jgi:hypothetical protein
MPFKSQNGAPRAKPVVPPQEHPPTPSGAEAFRCASAKASKGYPPIAKSAEAVIPRLRISTNTSHAFTHGQSP